MDMIAIAIANVILEDLKMALVNNWVNWRHGGIRGMWSDDLLEDFGMFCFWFK
tara:strand:+ start:499 stop:657 length:159 start_codon:yes stop_codon:yes gene_type:complete